MRRTEVNSKTHAEFVRRKQVRKFGIIKLSLV